MFIEKIAESKFFHRICESTRGALCRFPLAMLLFFWMSLISFDGAIGLDIVAENWRRALVFYFLLAGTLAAIVQLAAEMWHLSVLRRELVQAFSQLLFLAVYWLHVQYIPQVWALCIAFFLLLFSVPALRRGTSDEATWSFGYRILLGVSFGAVLSAVTAFGLFILCSSIGYTLGIRINQYGTAISFMSLFMVMFPLSVLCMIPVDMEEKEPETYLLRGMSFILGYVFIPFLLIYAVVFYAGLVRVGFYAGLMWADFPGFMHVRNVRDIKYDVVGPFLLLGLSAYVLAFRFRDNSTRLLRFFVRHFFKIAIIPTIVLTFVLIKQFNLRGYSIANYGAAAGCAAFWVWIFLHLFMRKHFRLVLIPAVAAVCTFLFSIGVFYAVKEDIREKKIDVATYLSSSGILDVRTGIITPLNPPRKLDHLSHEALSRGVMYFAERNALGELRELIDPVASRMRWSNLCSRRGYRSFLLRPATCDRETYLVVDEILTAWGVETERYRQSKSRYVGFLNMHFPANNRAITTGGYDYILNGNLRWNNNGSRITERKVEELTAEDNKDTGVFVVIAPDGKVGVQTGDDDTSWISVEGFLHDFLAYEQQAEEGARPKSHRRQTLPHGHPYREKAVFIFDEPEYAAELTILGIGYEEETTTDKEYEIKLTHVQYMLRFSKKQDETSADSRNGD